MLVLHATLLLLLPLALLPIILHLITLHRLKSYEFGAFQFLFDSFQRQRSRLRFMDALLTALRTFFLLFLVFMFSRPAIKHWAALFQSGGNEIIVAVDCSASMQAVTDGATSMDRAKTAAHTILRRADRSARITLVRMAAQSEELATMLPPDDPALARRIDNLETAPVRADIPAALKRFFSDGTRRHAIATVYLITDNQESSWRESQSHALGETIPRGARLVVVDTGSRRPPPNRAIVGSPPLRQDAVAGWPVIFSPRIVNRDRKNPAELTARVLVDNREVAREQLALRPGEERAVEIAWTPRETGLFKGRFEIETDSFPADNAYQFSLPVTHHVTVLLVNGNPSGDPFADEGLYLKTALTVDPALDAQTQVGAAERTILRAIQLKVLTESQLTQGLMAEASVVILANCGLINETGAWLIRDYVKGGGGLIIFPGDLVTPAKLNKTIFPEPGPQRDTLMGIEVDNPEGTPQDPLGAQRISFLDFQHPVLSSFNASSAPFLATARFYRWFPIRQIEGTRMPSWAWARFSSGKPALVESRFGRGTVICAAFPATTAWGNLPLKPEFVPLLLRMVNHVQRRGDLQAPPTATAEGQAEIAVPSAWSQVTGTVTDEKGHTTPLVFKRTPTRWLAVFESPRCHGFHTADIQGFRDGKPQVARTLFAVNIPAGETDFTHCPRSAITAMCPGAKVHFVDATAQAQQLENTIGEEREIWRILIWMLFVIIAVEFALATFGGKDRSLLQRLAPAFIGLSDHLPDRWAKALRRALESATPRAGQEWQSA